MIIVGFVLLAAAAVVAVALIIQNPATVTVHAFKWSWDVDMRWLFIAGLALTAIGLLGLAMMRVGGAYYLRLRRDRKVLAAENERLIKRAGTVDERPRIPAEPRPPMPAAPVERAPAPPPATTAPVTTPPAPAAPPPSGPMAPATGSVAAPERPATSTHPHGLRERLAATRHRHEKE